jgi:uncharacterized SAM-binding protein YcdF (DUF218 family)
LLIFSELTSNKSRLILIAFQVFVGLMTLIAMDGLFAIPEKADLCIVPGNTVNANGHPSPRLQAHLDEAARLYRSRLAPYIFVSGGVGKEGFSEARVMRDALIAQAIPDRAILMDEAGNTTYLTAQHAAALMRQRQWHSTVVVSQYFHLPRARLALHRFGIAQVYSSHPNFVELRDFYSIAREVFAYATYFIRPYKNQ